MEWISYETKYVVGLSEAKGGSGNPAVVTGFGVYQGMRACAQEVWGDPSLEGKTVAMQGYGNVATSLADYLLKAGAKLVATDINEDARKRAAALHAVTVVEPDAIFDAECDIFAPCALGGAMNEQSIPRLKCAIVCGPANNQLAEGRDGNRLQRRGILYAPDYIVNSGGVTNVYYELGREYSREAAMAKTSEIFDAVTQVIGESKSQGVTTAEAADRIAEKRLESMRNFREG
jgi:leucine dehydrogenase